MIILYNGKTCENYHRISSKFKVLPNYSEELQKHYVRLNQNFNDIFFDRTGILPKLFKTKDFPLPLTDKYVEKSFETVCIERAQELINTNKVINVWWSGGLDSTCIIASIIPLLKNREQLVIQMTHSSIVESGTMFENYIRNNFKYNLLPITGRRYVPKDELSISGFVGNHIMGQGSTNQSYPFEDWDKPWQIFVDKHPRIRSESLEFIEPVMQIYPKLNTFFDFMRFYMIVFKWNQDLYLHHIRDFEHESFYDTKEFQQWAMYSNELPYANGLVKLPMKQIIQRVFPDENYYYNKKARASQLLLPEIKTWAFILEDRTVVNGGGFVV
jgi:hypothetical protein